MKVLNASNGLWSIGIYSVPEAARLTGMGAGRIRRWLTGYRARGRWYEPLWTPQVQIEDETFLSFADLIEFKAAQAFLQEGVSAQTIRAAIEAAQRYIEDERPLSNPRLRTDGRAIFLEIAEGSGDARLLELVRGQYAFGRLIERSLRNVEIDDDEPVLWWPRSKRGGVVLDPKRSFGQPIEAESGVPTSVLANAAAVEGGVKEAARAWSVPVRSVVRAVDFEEWYEAA